MIEQMASKHPFKKIIYVKIVQNKVDWSEKIWFKMCLFSIFRSNKPAPEAPPNLFGEPINDQDVRTNRVGLSILGTLLGFLVGAFSVSLTLGLFSAILLHKRGQPKETIKITMIAIASLGGLYGAYTVFKSHPDEFAQNFFRGRKAQDPDF